jgi:hypothetical protein
MGLTFINLHFRDGSTLIDSGMENSALLTYVIIGRYRLHVYEPVY